MKALVYTGPEALDYRDAADPAPGADQHLVRIRAVGICGSDMHAYLGHDDRRPAPLILGHEGAGVIEGGPRDGERVTINPLVSCGTCRACQQRRDNLCPERMIISMPPREGAFAQYVVMRDQNLIPVPDHVSLDVASLAEPMAVSWHAVRLGLEACGSFPPERALVIGGGAIGVAAALCLRAISDVEITLSEPSDLRRSYLAERTDITAVAPDAVEGDFDIVLDAVGIDPTRSASTDRARPGGVIVHVGLGGGSAGLDIRRMTLQEITFIGTYTYTPQDFRDCCAAMWDGRLGPLDWTEARPLSDGAQAFADNRRGAVPAPKIILHP